MEERTARARRVDMKFAFAIGLLLLALVGALAELTRGQRPVLIARPA
jgi:hypothetical protein